MWQLGNRYRTDVKQSERRIADLIEEGKIFDRRVVEPAAQTNTGFPGAAKDFGQ
jgi:hypothetical protein